MAEIFWLHGGGSRETSPPHPIAIDVAEEKLVPYAKEYFDEPPHARDPRFAHDDRWHVFLRVNDEETNGNFPEEGYYEVVHVTPDDCRQLFGLNRS